MPFALAARRRRGGDGVASIVLERLLYRRLYGGDELDQVLLTMGLVFMSVAGATYLWGPLAQPMQPPPGSAARSISAFAVSRLSQLSDRCAARRW